MPLLERKLVGAFGVDFLGYADVAANREQNCWLITHQAATVTPKKKKKKSY